MPSKKTQTPLHRKREYVFLVVFPLVAVLLSLLLPINLFFGLILFHGLPALWLSYQCPKKVPKVFFFTILFTLPFALIVEGIAEMNNAWWLATAFDWRALHIVPVEAILWSILAFYHITIFYEYFVDGKRIGQTNKRIKVFSTLLFACLALFLIVFFLNPLSLQIPYAYLWLGIVVGFLPALCFLIFHKKLLRKFALAAAYFFYVNFTLEMTALSQGRWGFGGTHFIGWVNISGLGFPLEEFIFYFIVATFAILAYYEYFVDDTR